MPIYEYKCQGCGLVVPRHRESDMRHASTVCPECQAVARLTPSIPAAVPVGKYGKGGGQ